MNNTGRIDASIGDTSPPIAIAAKTAITYVGQTRVATRLNHKYQSDTGYEQANTYYYHPDHLGSAQLVTDPDGQEYEHLEYTPYGELWVEQTRDGIELIPFRFTGKELDAETGLYYYGARYLDPKTSVWLSADPALGEYVPGAPIDDEAKKRNGNLPGMGGVFNTVNLHLYHYAGNNPIKYTDPTGEFATSPPVLPVCLGSLVANPPPNPEPYTAPQSGAPKNDPLPGTEVTIGPASSGERFIMLFRVVGAEEAAALKETGRFTPNPTGLPKYFALDPGEAIRYGRDWNSNTDSGKKDPYVALFFATIPESAIEPWNRAIPDRGLETIVLDDEQLILLSDAIKVAPVPQE